MFSGIVEDVGTIARAEALPDGRRLWISSRLPVTELSPGTSVCVSGVCLTVVDRTGDTFAVEVVSETLRRTTLGALSAGSPVNLERSLRLGDRVSGHLVFGHVDGTGCILDVKPEGTGAIYSFSAPESVTRYLVEKGSVAVDGVSLTVFHCEGNRFRVAITPYTAQATVLGRQRPGDAVNLEADMLGKYVERFVQLYCLGRGCEA